MDTLSITTKSGSIEIEEEYLSKLFENCKEEVRDYINNVSSSVVIPYNKILLSMGHEIATKILEEPEKYLELLSLYFTKRLNLGKTVKVRIKDISDKTRIKRIRDIRSEDYGKVIQVDGIIKVSSSVVPVINKVKYRHEECGNEFWLETKEFSIEKLRPIKCPICRKTTGKFIKLEEGYIDVQRLLIEEPAEQIEKGEQPDQIVVILKEDLCEPRMERKTIPGTRVRIAGIVKNLKKQTDKLFLEKYIDAIYIEPLDKDIEEIRITPEDESKIREIAKSEDVLSLIARSIAPDIFGKQYEVVKKAIALQLVGGADRNDKKFRKNIHILLVGDPGTGKSTLLLSVYEIAPKSRFVTGITATSVGLTASVRKDEILKGGWTLEAGALVLASGGIICIDEMDKLSTEELQHLHEAMEHKTITIDKANIHATLRADTSVLAAANPKFGRWDRMKSIVDQIDLPVAIINRFDLIFILQDIPNPEIDGIIADEILGSLKHKPQPPIPLDLLRKYIAYAKKINPEWTDRAIERVKRFYLELRSRASSETIPITLRQLNSIRRLAEASAKIRLSEVVTEEDVILAESLLTYSLRQVGINPETSELDIDLITTGFSSTERKRGSKILEIIKELSKDFPGGVPISEILKSSEKLNIDPDYVKNTIEKLLKEGYIYESGPEKFLPTS
ncbi:AAA family ATPase [Nanoarchaeota archaeon NZ13-N]|nr:MAG: AAA family ATPase [Nanoarchaeota archaeon NZ13-N]